jgi:hypothetical protein
MKKATTKSNINFVVGTQYFAFRLPAHKILSTKASCSRNPPRPTATPPAEGNLKTADRIGQPLLLFFPVEFNLIYFFQHFHGHFH